MWMSPRVAEIRCDKLPWRGQDVTQRLNRKENDEGTCWTAILILISDRLKAGLRTL